MNRNVLLVLLALFFSVFMICAGLLQLRSGLAPQKSSAVIDHFNGALLWFTSFMALLIAATRPRPDLKFLFWLGVCAGFSALAIDEVFEFHERTRHALGDDDYIKMLAWAAAFVGVFMIYRVAKPARMVMQALVIGLGFTTLWLLSDLGDGDFFTIPIPLATLFWLEEYFELLASQFYLTALILHYQDEFVAVSRQPEQRASTVDTAATALRPRLVATAEPIRASMP
jgi:hypothetical protein